MASECLHGQNLTKHALVVAIDETAEGSKGRDS